jgi:glucosamine-6-phosphate deaminase
MCQTLVGLGNKMGHEVALEIKKAKDNAQMLALILPVDRWACIVGLLLSKGMELWIESCIWFHMDEWSDGEGNTLDPKDPGAFQNARQRRSTGPLGKLTVPESQRNFATHTNLPNMVEDCHFKSAKGPSWFTVYGMAACSTSLLGKTFAAEFDTEADWKSTTARAKLHPLTVEQNALTSLKADIRFSRKAKQLGRPIFKF